MAVKIIKYGEGGKTKEVEVTHEGAVLYTGERNYPDDSDFYALVWDEEKQRVESIEYASTRFYTYGNSAQVDATDEVWEKVRKLVEPAMYKSLLELEEHNERRLKLFRKVKVVKGRKVPIGTVASVFWLGNCTYNGWVKVLRVGLLLEDGSKVFTSAENVEVVVPEPVISEERKAELKEAARVRAERREELTYYLRGGWSPIGMVVI